MIPKGVKKPAKPMKQDSNLTEELPQELSCKVGTCVDELSSTDRL